MTKWTAAPMLFLGLSAGCMVFAVVKFKDLTSLVASMQHLGPEQSREYRQELANAKTGDDKCFPLAELAKDDFNEGNISEARDYATRLLKVGEKLPDKGSGAYGIAVHDGNMVLGRIALAEHKTSEAKEYLLKAGKTPGAPTLNSFGPNMSLAKDLLAVGERDTVLQYFEECRKFWGYQAKTLDSWEADVKAGETPSFGANLIY